MAAFTGRGAHYYYQTTERASSRRFPWGDVKAEGGYVVAPPSIHETGAVYRWGDLTSPDQHHLEDLPPSILQRPEDPREQGKREPQGGTRSKKHRLYDSHSPAPDPRTSSLTDWACRADVAETLLRSWGVGRAKIGEGFCCILPGHEERKPSAALYQMDSGVIMYHDFHGRDGATWYTLAEVYAARATRKVRKLNPGEQAVWFLRALREHGFVKPPAVMAPRLPDDAPAIVQDVYRGFRDLLSLRMVYEPSQVSAPYSWAFASSWVGKGQRQCGEAIGWLMKAGYLVPAGRAPGRRTSMLFAIGTPKAEGGDRQ